MEIEVHVEFAEPFLIELLEDGQSLFGTLSHYQARFVVKWVIF